MPPAHTPLHVPFPDVNAATLDPTQVPRLSLLPMPRLCFARNPVPRPSLAYASVPRLRPT